MLVMRREFIQYIRISTLVLLVAVIGFLGGQKAQAHFDPNNLNSDGDFIYINKIDSGSIQRFLERQNSFLKDYSENGRSAAQIIYDASHGYGEASGTINGIIINSSTGTVNPEVIIVTLQKEQSLITKTERDDNALSKAMGYGCPDSGGCNPSYAGFTKQIENAAWQLRYNYERAQGRGFSDYQVGQSFLFEDWNGVHSGILGNRATSALYRYTPHVYNGNYNFVYFKELWFSVAEFAHSVYAQNAYPTLNRGSAYAFQVIVTNTGSATWTRGQVNLGTTRARDRVPQFTREGNGSSGWISPNRVRFDQTQVAPGENATFTFWMRNDGVSPGTYREYFQLVADGIGWMEDYGIYWDVSVPTDYAHQHLSQGAYPTLSRGESANLWVRVRNAGSQTWTQGQVNLGTARERDRITPFTREGNGPSGWISPNRIKFQEASVAPGQTATFSFWIRNDGVGAGTYREYYQLVADGVAWMEDYGIYWDVYAQ